MGSIVVPFWDYRILNMNPQKELLWSLRVNMSGPEVSSSRQGGFLRSPRPKQRSSDFWSWRPQKRKRSGGGTLNPKP